MDVLVKLFDELECQWGKLKNNQDDEELMAKEFPKLVEFMLRLNLDFRMFLKPDWVSEEQKVRIKDILQSLKLDSFQMASLELVNNVESWASTFGQSLLSGKFIGHLSGKYVQMEKLFVKEDDCIIQTRIDTLMHLFELSNDEDVSTMILNVFETYRKFILRDTGIQNKISCSTIDKLQKNYMIILFHRKHFEHLNSLIKTFPNYRKIKYLADKCKSLPDTQKGKKTKVYEIRIAAACAEELLRCEFGKKRLKQDIHFFHFYLNHLIDLAEFDKKVKDDLERIILSAGDMNVISDYYYLAATLLRFKKPNNYNLNLVLKLMSVGLSHDISYLEEIKYSTDKEIITTSRGEVSREEEFILVHRRMHLALLTLGCLIPHYPLARLCFHVSSVCEPGANFCKRVLEKLPECDYNDYDVSSVDPVLRNIRYLLETFHYDIKGSTRLTTTFKTVSSCSFESLEYFNHRVQLGEDLKPLEYPGVEKYLKKQNTEDTTHVSQVSNLDKCLKDNEEFNVQLSKGFKNLLHKFINKKPENPPSQIEVFEMVKEILIHADNVYITNTNEIYTDLLSINFKQIYSNDFKQVEEYIDKRQKENYENLYFDWKNYDECGVGNDKETFDLDDVFKSGVVKVLKLYRKGYCTFDIENILLFAIYEKKMKFLSEEFAYLNKNRNVEMDAPQLQNQIHAGFLYIINRRHPEFCRLSRLTTSLKKYYHAIEYYLDSYIFDATPAKYKFLLKYKTYKTKVDASGVSENSAVIENIPVEIKQEFSESLPSANDQKPKRRAAKRVTVKVETTDGENQVELFQIPRKSNVPNVVILNSNDKFRLSEEIQIVFLQLQNEMSILSGRVVRFNIEKLVDSSSKHTISAVSMEKSTIPLQLLKVRNGNDDPRKYQSQVELAVNAKGKIILTQEFRDEIEYDEFNDNPKIKTVSLMKVSGSIVIEKLTHNVRFEIDCNIDSYVSKLKCIFQGCRARPKKLINLIKNRTSRKNNSFSKVPAQNSNKPPVASLISDLPDSTTNILQNTLQVPAQSSLPPPSTYIDVVPNNDNYLNYNKTSTEQQQQQQQQQNSYLPPFGSIAPSTSHFLPQPSISQYNQPPVFCTSVPSQDVAYSSTPPDVPYSNGHEVFQNTVIKQEVDQDVVDEPLQQPSLPSNHQELPVKVPKVEIQKVEIITPPKVAVEKSVVVPNEILVKKLSFSSIPEKINIPAQNGHSKHKVSTKEIDELVDFEDAIGSVTKPAIIPIVIPKYEISKSIQKISNALQSERNQVSPTTSNEQNIHPIAEKVSVIKLLPKAPVEITQNIQDVLQKSPPPLHHYTKENNCQNSDVRTPTKAETKFLPNNIYDSGVIVKNEAKINEDDSETIDLTDDTYDLVDLTVNYSSSRREVLRKAQKQKSTDFAFVACSEEPIRNDRYINGPKPLMYKSVKRPPSSSEHETRNIKIRLVDVMENLKQENTLKKNTAVRLIQVQMRNPEENYHFVAEAEPTEEQPIEEYADDLYDTEFTIVNYNSHRSY